MSWTKRQFVNQAFEMIGLANYTFYLQSEQLQSACRILDAMMATWYHKNLQLGYPLPSNPQDTDLDTETEVPDTAAEAIYSNLAVRIAPTLGRQVMPELKQAAFAAYQALLAQSAVPNEMQFPNTLPRGAGNKPWRYQNANYTEDPITVQPWDVK